MVGIEHPFSLGQRSVCHRCQTGWGRFSDTGDIAPNVAYCPAHSSVTQVTAAPQKRRGRTTVQPQLLPANVVPHWYAGGPALAAWRGLPPVGERSPEEWVGSTVARFGEPNLGPARLADGTLLGDAVRADPSAWLGRDDGAPGDTGVLVKLLDAGQRLPVHVHPTREYASRHLGCAYGKTEAWYVLEADDGVLVPGGTPHAIGAGVLLVEAQEPTDQSILLERTNTTASDDEIFLGLPRDVALSAVQAAAVTDVSALTR